MSNCYICEQEILQDNTYNEHIQLNSLGGKLKSKDIICGSCAPFFDLADAALGKLLNPIAAQLNIDRDRGTPPPFEVDAVERNGERYVLMPGGKPRLHIPIVNINGERIEITVSDEQSLRKVLKGMKKKNPGLTNEAIELLIKGAEKLKENIGEVEYSINLGDESLLRAICKMAMSFYIYRDGDRENIAHLIPYIKGQEKPENSCIGYYYPLSNKPYDYLQEQGRVVHSLFVKGDPSQEKLYGLIQLFGNFRFLVLLNDNYHGEQFETSYTFDVLSREEIADNLWEDFQLSSLEIQKISLSNIEENGRLESLFLNELESKMQTLQDFIIEKQLLDNFKLLNRETIEAEFKNISEGEIVTDDCLRRIAEGCAENLMVSLHDRNMLDN